ncbi:MAG: tRNA uridine-5-carboxymethylaminomethyl(34) synthesis GTPase MnmE [Lachnospiraceae bacterium]|nr:tRNA uridine-5-carboxymethylaminomethyl(34) synthesis GTPase MnmE [Lachnospiraceae bacterium]
MQNDTIAGIASGMGGGIGIIRVSGEKCLDIVGKIFRNKKYVEKYLKNNEKKNIIKCKDKEWNTKYFENKETYTIHYGFIVDDDKIIDEVLIMLMKGPNSYTKEDVIEIDCHGGPYVVQKVLQTVIKNGARLSEPGEFTKRAFLNGRIDLSQAEAVMKVISSKSDFALNSAIKQLEGGVSNYIEEIRQEILHNLGFIEAALDDPEHYDLDGYGDELAKITSGEISKLEDIIEKFNDGRMKSEGINTVIVGKPNAGKSSLMNLLLDEERAIVTDIAGTTRDVLEERVKLGDIILNLVDTAGIHDTDDIVESMGVSKAVDYIENADFIIYVVDSSVELDEADDRIIDILKNSNGVILMNKTDLDIKITKEQIKEKLDWDCIEFSNETGHGLDELTEYITNSFLDGNVTYNDQVYLTSMRHKEAVESAIVSLKNVVDTINAGMPEDFYTIDMMDAYKKLGLINGETASEDLVNKIFKDFCMGK